MSRTAAAPATAARNVLVAALLALAAAATIAQPRESFIAPADSAQAMTMPQGAATAIAAK